MRAWSWCLVVALTGFGLSACGGSLNGGGDGGTDAGTECGNGEVEGTEACDDGVDNSDTVADACRTDCSEASCGDAVVDTGEECDDGNEDLGDGCEACVSTAVCGDDMVEGAEECEPGVDPNCHAVGHMNECQFIRSAFRMKSLDLIDPTIKFAPGCNDGIHPLVVDALSGATREDKSSDFAPPQDGLIDLGFVFTFAPQNQGDGESSNATFLFSDCNRLSKPSPVPNPSPCAPSLINDPSATDFPVTTQATGTCLAEIPDTTQDNTTVNPIEAGEFGCFKSAPVAFTFALGTVVQIPLTDVTVAGTWDADPASNIVAGLIRGFLSEADAETSIIDPSTLFLGGQTLKQSFGSDESLPLPPAPGSCDERDDNGGVSGYWVYLGFTAEAVPWVGGLMCGNGVVDTGGPGRDETCDTAIAAGEEGDCAPLLDCDDGFACTEDTLNAGDSCAPTCFNRAFNDNTDGCCPMLAPEGTELVPANGATGDQDCIDLCDDGTLQGWEACDDTAGTACDDPDVLCADDGDACTNEVGLVVTGTVRVISNRCVSCPEGACECRVTNITRGDDGSDGCCPPVCQRVDPPPPAHCNNDTNCL